jgi:3-polyprenyl-4-hydroxybenzoate decarboxylase
VAWTAVGVIFTGASGLVVAMVALLKWRSDRPVAERTVAASESETALKIMAAANQFLVEENKQLRERLHEKEDTP